MRGHLNVCSCGDECEVYGVIGALEFADRRPREHVFHTDPADDEELWINENNISTFGFLVGDELSLNRGLWGKIVHPFVNRFGLIYGSSVLLILF